MKLHAFCLSATLASVICAFSSTISAGAASETSALRKVLPRNDAEAVAAASASLQGQEFDIEKMWPAIGRLVETGDKRPYVVIEGTNLVTFPVYASHFGGEYTGNVQVIPFRTPEENPIGAPQWAKTSLYNGEGFLCKVTLNYLSGYKMEYNMNMLIDAYGLSFYDNFWRDVKGKVVLNADKCLVSSACWDKPFDSLWFPYENLFPSTIERGQEYNPDTCWQKKEFPRQRGVVPKSLLP